MSANVDGIALQTTHELSAVGKRAIRRIAYRLLPFVFLIYVVNYIDRVNVSFANLRMSADLGFSDKAYGFGVGIFYVTYVLFEIPGAIIVERWSARKWIARIMISWGIITILIGFVHTAGQFYAARFLLAAAESSFFPGMIVYLTQWFRLRERSRAIACLYTAIPAASLGVSRCSSVARLFRSCFCCGGRSRKRRTSSSAKVIRRLAKFCARWLSVGGSWRWALC
jgi:MFS transporter, ACS family, tartrate transporter